MSPRRLLGVSCWLLADGALRQRRRTAWAVLASALSVSLQSAALAAVFTVVRALERGEDIRLGPLRGDARESTALVLAIAAACAGLLAFAGLLRWSGTTTIVDIRRRYEEHCARRVLALASRSPRPSHPEHARVVGGDELSWLMTRGGRACGRTLEALLLAAQPMWRIVAAAAAMVAISAPTTIVVAAGVAVVAVLLRDVAQRARRNTTELDVHAGVPSGERRRLIGLALGAGAPFGVDDRELDESFRRGPTAHGLDLYYQRFLLRARSTLVADLFLAACFPTLLVIGALSATSGRTSWSVFAAYLFALRVFLGDVGFVANLSNTVGRRSSRIARYQAFVGDAPPVEEPPPSGPVTVTIDVPSLADGSGRSLTLEPGDRAVVLDAGGVDHRLAALLAMRSVTEPPVDVAYGCTESSDRPVVLVDCDGDAPASAQAERVTLLVRPDLPACTDPALPVLVVAAGVVGWAPAGWLIANEDALAAVGHRRAPGVGRLDDEDDDDL